MLIGNATAEAVVRALSEDLVEDDVTTRWSVPADATVQATVIARQHGVVAGLEVLKEVYRQVDPSVRLVTHVEDGKGVTSGTHLARLHGSARSVVTGERVALNFLQRLSGIATLTSRYVRALAGTDVVPSDTV